MSTNIRPEVSDKNKYCIDKHRYYELKHFCLQYPDWKQAYVALDGLSRRPDDLVAIAKTNQVSDPTVKCAESREFYSARMDMVRYITRK